MRVTCPTCLGATRVTEEKTDHKGRTIKTTKKCPRCGGRGLVEQ